MIRLVPVLSISSLDHLMHLVFSLSHGIIKPTNFHTCWDYGVMISKHVPVHPAVMQLILVCC